MHYLLIFEKDQEFDLGSLYFIIKCENPFIQNEKYYYIIVNGLDCIIDKFIDKQINFYEDSFNEFDMKFDFNDINCSIVRFDSRDLAIEYMIRLRKIQLLS